MDDPNWLRWCKALQGLAQAGLTYCRDPYDLERYEAIRSIAAEMLSAHGGVDPAVAVALYRDQKGYETPKVDVRGIVLEGDRILLIQEASDGKWAPPGGWADPNESPSLGVVREIREESGYEAEAVRLLAVYDRTTQGHVPPFPFQIYKIFILCRLVGGSPQTSIETSGVGFFSRHDLPPLSTGRILQKQIERFFTMVEQNIQAADFD